MAKRKVKRSKLASKRTLTKKKLNNLEVKELQNGEEYVPANATKYTKLEKKYFLLYQFLKDKDRRWEWASKKIGKDIITPEDLYELCRENIIAYVVFMKNRTPFPHQIKGMLDLHKNKYFALCWSRRLGKSFELKWYADWSCRFNKHPVEDDGTKWSVMMQNKDNGKEVYMEKAYLELRDGDLAVMENFQGELGDNFFSGHLVNREEKYGQVTGYKFTYNTLEDMSYNNFIAYNNANKKEKKKFRIVPSSLKVLTSPRGIEGNIIADEIAFWHKNPHLKDTFKVYDEEIRPIVTSEPHLKCVICSTPNGSVDNVFNELFDPTGENGTYYKKSWFPCWVHQTKPEYIKQMHEMREDYARKGKSHVFQQEYEAKFVRSKDAFFNETHIDRMFDDKITFTMQDNSDCYISIDWGGTLTSHTVMSVVSLPSSNDPSYVKYYKEYDINEDYTIVDDAIRLVNSFPNYRKIICDNKGGRFEVQRLRDALGDHKVDEFNFRSQKEAGYFSLKTAIANGNLKCPYDKRIREQMRNFSDKLKPTSKDIGDDILDTIMMPVSYMKIKEDSVYEVINYDDEDDGIVVPSINKFY